MAGHAFTHEDGELAVPALENYGQLGARGWIGLRAARHQKGTQAAFDGLAQPEHHRVRARQRHSKSFREFRAVQSVPVGQIQQFAVAVR